MSSHDDQSERRIFLILLEEPHAWVAAATIARQAPPGSVETLISPVPGVGFMAAQGREAAELDEWWRRMAVVPGRPVVITAHEDELAKWIPGLDADFVIAVPDEETLDLYRHLPNVQAAVSDDARQLAELAVRSLRLPRAPLEAWPAQPPAVHGAPPAAAEPPPRETRSVSIPTPQAAVSAVGPSPSPAPGPATAPPTHHVPPARPTPPPMVSPAPPPPMVGPPPPPMVSPAPPPDLSVAASSSASSDRQISETQPAGVQRVNVIDPFELLARAETVELPPMRNGSARPGVYGAQSTPMSRRSVLGEDIPKAAPVASQLRPRPPAAPSRGGLDPRQILDRLGQGRRAPVSAELGQAVLACKPIVAAVVSRKGGVGKTASAAAVAAILGEAVDPFGHTAALVDANIGNPDAWGRLDVQGKPATMRDVVRRLMAGQEPPSPSFAETPALAVYPEAREASDGYAPAQIQRAATYLKGRHAAVVVDLPNRLPAFTSAEAAVAAAWIGEADVLVLPTTADPTALLGAIEYLDADSVQGKPVVVSYIVPRARQIRDAPQVRAMLDRIRGGVTALVEVPDDDRATLALIQRIAITEVANELRQAYMALATRVVEAAASRNGWGG